MLRIQVFGAVRAWRDGDELALGPARQRAVLGLLALAVGRPLGSAEMIDSLWGEDPPSSARNVVQTYVKHLRRILEPHRSPYTGSAVLPRVNSGYVLRLPGEDIDVVRFRRAVADSVEAQRLGDQRRVATLLGDALRLWRGAPLADIPGLAEHPKAIALVAERRAALVRYGAAMIAIGCAAEALPMLEEAAAEQPLDEATQARLILAYRAAGHRAEALEAYRRVRERLADELGVDPGPEVIAAYRALLGDENPAPAPTRELVPAQLPAAVVAFAGRAEHLRRLDGLVPKAGAVTPAVAVISGTAGVGKTALAVHWAHRVTHRFPDGQLYLNLRGFDAGGQAMEPDDAVRAFLDAFQVPPQQVPATVVARAALYRSLIASRRMLVLLDNARDAGQVRPLLPGAPGCLVVVTSRHQMPGLIATEGARAVMLDLLTVREAERLLAGRIGAHRTDAEPEAVRDLIVHCARLPLALAIVAARAVVNPRLPLRALATELRDSRGRLAALALGDPATDPRAVFSWSYRTLSPEAARLLRLLGLHPGPDIAAPAAAGVAGSTVEDARTLLAELARTNLVLESTPGRYSMHDLLRVYAAEQVRPDETDAVGRILDHYLHTGHAAAVLLQPHRDAIPMAPPRDGAAPQPLDDQQHALAWFAAELPVLLAAVDHAAAHGYDVHVWQLAWSLTTYLYRCGRWHDEAAVQRAALAAARRLGDPAEEARSHRLLSQVCIRQGRLDDAADHLRQALDASVRGGDVARQGHAEFGLAVLAERQGRYDLALGHGRNALELYRRAGHRHGQADALNQIGWFCAHLGDDDEAYRCCSEALEIFLEMDSEFGAADTWDSLGYIQHRRAEYADAVRCFEQAVGLYRGFGDRYGEADTLTRLGDTWLAAGNTAEAHRVWRLALAILDELEHPDAAAVRARLSA